MAFVPRPDEVLRQIPGLSTTIANMPLPNPHFGGLGGALRRFNTGATNVLDRLGAALTPIDPTVAQEMSPDQIQQLRRQAMLNLGLGLLAGRDAGMGFGQAALGALQQAQGTVQGAMQNAYRNALLRRQEQREAARDAESRRRFEADLAYRMERDRLEDERERARMEQERAYREALLRQRERLTPEQAAAAEQVQRDRQRIAELLAKPTRTEAEEIELEYLTRGAVSNLRRGAGLLGSFMGSGLGGPMVGGNPLLTDPRMLEWETGGFSGRGGGFRGRGATGSF